MLGVSKKFTVAAFQMEDILENPKLRRILPMNITHLTHDRKYFWRWDSPPPSAQALCLLETTTNLIELLAPVIRLKAFPSQTWYYVNIPLCLTDIDL